MSSQPRVPPTAQFEIGATGSKEGVLAQIKTLREYVKTGSIPPPDASIRTIGCVSSPTGVKLPTLQSRRAMKIGLDGVEAAITAKTYTKTGPVSVGVRIHAPGYKCHNVVVYEYDE